MSTNFVLELKTNYQQLVPEDKVDEVMRVLKKYLPKTEPRWYLEANIDQKRIHPSPSESSITRGRNEWHRFIRASVLVRLDETTGCIIHVLGCYCFERTCSLQGVIQGLAASAGWTG